MGTVRKIERLVDPDTPSLGHRYLRERGRDRMIGPFDFSTNHECGLLVEGHEWMPQILENWHHPYYRDLLEGEGFVKAMDLYKWEIDPRAVGDRLPIINELARPGPDVAANASTSSSAMPAFPSACSSKRGAWSR